LGPNLFVRCNNHNKNGKHKEYWDKFNGDGSKIEEMNLLTKKLKEKKKKEKLKPKKAKRFGKKD